MILSSRRGRSAASRLPSEGAILVFGAGVLRTSDNPTGATLTRAKDNVPLGGPFLIGLKYGKKTSGLIGITV